MAEWLPEIIPFYLSLLVDGDGMQMSISENGEVSEGVMDEGVTLNLVVLDDDEVTEEVYISVSSIAGSDAQTGADLWEGGLTFIYSDLRYEQEMGAQLWINQVTQTQDDAVTKDAVIDLSVLMNGTDYPVLTVTANTQQQAAGDLPFEVDDFNFVHPGAMDEEAFTEYMGTVQAAAMQAMLKVVSLLPPEVFEAMNTTTSIY